MAWSQQLPFISVPLFVYNSRKKLQFTTKKYIHGGMKVAVNIRMPENMKKALDKIAASEFRSLNSLILQLLDEQLKGKNIDWRKSDQKNKK